MRKYLYHLLEDGKWTSGALMWIWASVWIDSFIGWFNLPINVIGISVALICTWIVGEIVVKIASMVNERNIRRYEERWRSDD